MKKMVSALAIMLCLCTFIQSVPLLVSAIPSVTDVIPTAVNDNSPITETPSKISSGGYTTYTMADSTFMWQTPNVYVDGYTCTAVQGLNTGTNYCYVSKITSSEAVTAIVRINMNTGERITMNYYPSLTSTTPTGCDTVGHANELMVCGTPENGVTVNYLFAATVITGKALTRLKINGSGLYFTGYFDLVTTGGSSVTCGAMRHIKTEGGYFYFLIKRSANFYYCKIPVDASGGPASNPTKITIYKLFTADMRNAVFAKSATSYGTYDNIEEWTNQGFGYNHTEKVLYIPLWDGDYTPSRSVIITFNIAEHVTDERLEKATETSATVFPTVTSFMFQDTSESVFEIESCSFRTGQGTTGDRRLYFTINASSIAKEGVYTCSYTTGSGDFTPIVNESSVVWTTKYNANGGTGSMGNTNHIRGITTRLRPNAFTRSGYTFAGWYLTRKSDGKWLYFDEDGTARWYTKGNQPQSSCLALYEDRRSVSALSATNGDTVTCYAQWTPNSTGTKTFYVKYDANGGIGTMADTTVVYGTETATTKNAFTREGYVFSGWMAHRRSKNQWSYKNVNDLSGAWIEPGGATDGYVLRAYLDGCTLANTTSVDTDIVTFYAVWSRIANSVHPKELVQGIPFSIGGNVECDAGIYTVKLTVSDASGRVLYTYSDNPYSYSYDLSAANTGISFESLDVGEYRYKVELGTISGSAPTMHTLLDTAFTVYAPGIVLKDDISASGLYTLDDKYFTGFKSGIQGAEFKGLFKYDVTVKDLNGNEIDETDCIGTGFTLACGNEVRTAVLRADLNGDAAVTTSDYINMLASLKSITELKEAPTQAADLNNDEIVSAADCIIMVLLVKG